MECLCSPQRTFKLCLLRTYLQTKVEPQRVECTNSAVKRQGLPIADKQVCRHAQSRYGAENRCLCFSFALGNETKKKKINSRFGISFVLFITLFLLRPITLESTIHFLFFSPSFLFSFSTLPPYSIHHSSLKSFPSFPSTRWTRTHSPLSCHPSSAYTSPPNSLIPLEQ